MKLKRWVVKAGSNMVCAGGPLLLRAWMQQVSILRKKYKVEVIWVTSGAISTGAERTDFHKRKANRTLSEKQALSAIGQPIVMDLYNLALQETGQLGAQILLTYDDLASGARKKNFQNTLEKLLEWGMTPVLNENDAVATEEIKFGDNDSLSAKVAHVTGADRLIILTDVDGLYETDPRKNPNARLISQVPKVTSQLLSRVGQAPGSNRGTGGMYSKLRAAQEASSHGIETWLVKGDVPSVLIQVAESKSVGTRIDATGKKAKRR